VALLGKLAIALLKLLIGWTALFSQPASSVSRLFLTGCSFLLRFLGGLLLVEISRPSLLQSRVVLRRLKLLPRRLSAIARIPTIGFLRLVWPHSFASLLIACAGMSGTFYFGSQVAQAHQALPTPAIVTKSIVRPLPKRPTNFLPRSMPETLTIARLGINADIMGVGRLADGTIEMPPLFSPTVGWYDRGPTPGELGPGVIVGHVDTYKGPSVFWRLHELKPGDKIEIKRADKRTAVFRVEVLKQFEQNKFPTAEVYGNLDYAGLRLITCGGTFNHKTEHYSKNTVVFARLEPTSK
jgi:hypothetical protein